MARIKTETQAINKQTEPKREYLKNSRISLTDLKYQDRRIVVKKLKDKKVICFEKCPHCDSTDGYFNTKVIEQIEERHYLFIKEGEEITVVNDKLSETIVKKRNIVWESDKYLCVKCKKPIGYAEKI